MNVRGTNKPGTREEIETWMEQSKIEISLIQEARGKYNSREARKTHTWYFSSENPTNPQFATGIAVVIRNQLVKHILNIVPVNDRLMCMQIDHTTPTTSSTAISQQHRGHAKRNKNVRRNPKNSRQQ